MKFLKKSEVSQRFKKARIKANLGQNDIAKITGFKQSTVSRWEKGAEIPATAIAKIAQATNVPIEFLLTNDLPSERIKTAQALGKIIDQKDHLIEKLKNQLKKFDSKEFPEDWFKEFDEFSLEDVDFENEESS